MKKTLFLICIFFFFTNVNAQLVVGGFSQIEMNSIMLRKDNLRDSDITGSQYFNENFLMGKVSGIKESIELRYNAFSDEIEFRNPNDTIYTLIKDEKLNPIEIFKKKYIYTKYKNEKNEIVNGYLLEIYSGKLNLYKNEKIILIPAKEPRSGYDSYTPPKLQKSSSDYFLKLKDSNEIFVFPRNRKELISYYPNKENEIKEFLKSNKLGFSKEEDLMEITKFLENL